MRNFLLIKVNPRLHLAWRGGSENYHSKKKIAKTAFFCSLRLCVDNGNVPVPVSPSDDSDS